LVLPLIVIGPVADPKAVQAAWSQWSNWHAVMYVSAQAVRMFFAHQPMRLENVRCPRCWATGPGTRKALLSAGVPAEFIDSPTEHEAQFDSEALWGVVADQVQALSTSHASVLIVRGNDEGTHPDQVQSGSGRDWLTQQLQAAAVTVSSVAAYARSAPVWTTAQRQLATQAATDASVWCFSSSQAVTHLQQLMPTQTWAQARCIATHTRIAETALAAGFGVVHTARPLVADVVASLESLA
jgi:uroporphyrinogen-III synthase